MNVTKNLTSQAEKTTTENLISLAVLALITPLPLVILALFSTGCAGGTSGTKGAARQYFSTEFNKWIAGAESDVSTFLSGIYKALIGFDIRSIVKVKPSGIAVPLEVSANRPDDFETWPAYKINVAIEWESQAGSPMEKVTTYILTWNPHKQEWYAKEDR